ncbi:hypothetical protein C8J56DRAFT_969706 [Mycena floridula]|nr:hypothetical protein C8J56DRAFT_969706 [Mycena floridula]
MFALLLLFLCFFLGLVVDLIGLEFIPTVKLVAPITDSHLPAVFATSICSFRTRPTKDHEHDAKSSSKSQMPPVRAFPVFR